MAAEDDLEWWYVRALCKPEIAEKPWGEELYKTLVTTALLDAQQFLATELSRDPIPTMDVIRTTHFYAFRDVYDFAGEPRSSRDALVNESLRGASSHENIPGDLERLNAEARTFLLGTKTPEDRARLIAGYHARIVEIQPFLDGNKRTAAPIAEQQVRSLLGVEPRIITGRAQYKESMHAAMEGDLSALSHTLTGIRLGETHKKPPFTMSKKEGVNVVEGVVAQHDDVWPAPVYRTLPNGMQFGLPADNAEQARRIRTAQVDVGLLSEANRRGHTVGIPIDDKALFEAPEPRLQVDYVRLAQEQSQSQNRGIKR